MQYCEFCHFFEVVQKYSKPSDEAAYVHLVLNNYQKYWFANYFWP